MRESDTIVAVASAPGRGAIGVIRISGNGVPQVAAAVLDRMPAPRMAQFSRFIGADGGALDEGLALYFPGPHSFTGESALELHGHGGVQVLDLIFRRLLQLGCRAARPGEFSERAFLNGKIDLAEAEAVADLIDAGSAAAARAAVRSMRGEFSRRIENLRREITALRVLVEAAIDFPDEEIDFAPMSTMQAALTQILDATDAISAAAHQGVMLREGLQVVIAGRPNAGKSSLLNQLAGDDVAIVADVPGTTRDVLRQQVQIDGLTVQLIDTAGLRDAQDAVEAEGVRRARNEIGKADLVLYIVDAAAAQALPEPDAASLGAGTAHVIVFNKIDLLATRPGTPSCGAAPHLYVSTKTGEGLETLRNYLKSAAGFQPVDAAAFSARRRHLDALSRARAQIERAGEVLGATRAPELLAEELRLAQQALGEITGAVSSDDLLGEVFGSFCIGK